MENLPSFIESLIVGGGEWGAGGDLESLTQAGAGPGSVTRAQPQPAQRASSQTWAAEREREREV